MTTTEQPVHPAEDPAYNAAAEREHPGDALLVSELGKRALTARSFENFLQDALQTVSARLDTELVKILELVPNGEGFLLVAGIGWQPGYVGQVVVPLIPESQAGYTMAVGQAVIVEDLRKETRFRGMPLLHEHGVVSGISTVLRGHEKTHGIITAHSCHERPFTMSDMVFFDAVAAVVGAAMDRRDIEKQLQEASERLNLALAAGRLGAWEWNVHSGKVVWSDEVYATYGMEPGQFSGTLDAYIDLIHPDDKQHVNETIEEALGGDQLEMRYRIIRPNGEIRWLMSRGMVIRDARGEAVRMVGVCLDETDRRLDEIRHETENAATRALSEATSVADAFQGVLSAVCKTLEWPVGQLWLVDGTTGQLQLADHCETDAMDSTFAEASKSRTFTTGVGLPGRVLEDGQPHWIEDLGSDDNFPRIKEASEAGLKSGFAFPIWLDRQVIGVMEFFSTSNRNYAPDLLVTMNAIAGHLAQYIERRRAEQEREALLQQLTSAENRYHSVFQDVKDAILVSNEEGRFVEVNDAAADLLGYSREELLKLRSADVTVEWIPKNFASLTQGKGWSGEIELRRKDGNVVPVEVRATTVNLATGQVYVGVMRDITVRRVVDAQRTFLAEATAVLVRTLDYEETLANLARLCVPFLGDWCTVDTIDGDRLNRVAVVHDDPNKVEWAEEVRQKYPAYLRPNDPPTQMVRAGKTIRIAEMTEEIIRAVSRNDEMAAQLMGLGVSSVMVVPIQARGRTLGLLTLAAESPRSYTEDDQALAEDLGRRAGLAVDNARLYMESQAAQEELLRANASKDEFLGLVSHEMRTPMTTIQGGARLLRRAWDKIDEESRSGVLSDIEHQTERLQRIVEDLLALARVELGEEVQREPVLVQRLVDQAVTSYSKRRPKRVIELYEDPSTPPVNASALYLEQVLLNLLNNADKYSPAHQPIEVHTEMREGLIVISVLDRGPGIAKEDVDRIFERFYRSPDTAQKAGGAGIGLTVCKRLIEALGGSIWAELREGGGLVVSFSLPPYEDD